MAAPMVMFDACMWLLDVGRRVMIGGRYMMIRMMVMMMMAVTMMTMTMVMMKEMMKMTIMIVAKI